MPSQSWRATSAVPPSSRTASAMRSACASAARRRCRHLSLSAAAPTSYLWKHGLRTSLDLKDDEGWRFTPSTRSPTCTARAGTSSTPARPGTICTSSSAPSATRSTPASRSWSTPAAGSSASSAAPPSTPRPAQVGREPRRQALRRPPAVSSNGADPLRMPDGALVAKRDAPVGGQAVLEGVMMRGVSTWAVAVRNPEGQIEISSEPIGPLGEAPPPLAGAGDPRRRRPRRVDEDRLPRAGDLRQRPAGGGRGGREGRDRRLGLGADDRPLAGAGDRPLLRHPGRR